ncbi:MAG: hypothetical protein K2P99_04595 [Burkholderiales bacterium]|nr:hypothetical protein [Burkholderiales bacterium]
MKKVILLLSILNINIIFAITLPSPQDQQNAFNNAVATGNSYNSNSNLAPNFNYGSTDAGQQGVTSQFDKNTTGHYSASIMANSKAGTQGSEQEYNNASGDVNYLYNKGLSQIAHCKTESDPACLAVTKYNDDDTQKALSAYDMGTNAYAYSQTVKPDPNNSACSIIRTFKPLNPVNKSCIVGNHEQTDCQATISPYQTWEKLIPPDPVDGTVFNPVGSPGVCGVGIASGMYIPQSDRAWIILTSNATTYDANGISIVMGATSGVTPCRITGGSLVTTATYSRILLGQFYIDWLGSQRGNISFYQEAGLNCSGSNCNFSITMNAPGANYSWNITFKTPQTKHLVTHYDYNDGCKNYR